MHFRSENASSHTHKSRRVHNLRSEKLVPTQWDNYGKAKREPRGGATDAPAAQGLRERDRAAVPRPPGGPPALLQRRGVSAKDTIE